MFAFMLGALALTAVGPLAARSLASPVGTGQGPLCDQRPYACRDIGTPTSGDYVGHDEPSLAFYSSRPGSGNSMQYLLTLPRDPAMRPTLDSEGGTWNFQLHPTFWLGMALCDSQSAPEFTHRECTPDSDANIRTSGDPQSPDYVGTTPGQAYLELQFYPPGWVGSCSGTQWCAAVAVFSLNADLNRDVDNNADCLQRVGEEPGNYAIITLSGVPQAPPGPLTQTIDSYTPDPSAALFMNPGDQLRVSLSDTGSGLRALVEDLTTGLSGSMTASAANGFAQVLFEPHAHRCEQRPYDFHPMFSTSTEKTVMAWGAHTYNVGFSDEIGHFEYCAKADPTTLACTEPPPEHELDADDQTCFNASDSPLVTIGGCFGADAGDSDFDGPSYRPDWPGSGASASRSSEPITFQSPTFGGGQRYDRVAFEANLPVLEASCDTLTGDGCTNPPPGARFYPIFTTRTTSTGCIWQFGGPDLPGTTNTFGGDAAHEYGPLLFTPRPGLPAPDTENFRNVLSSNPC